MDLVGGFARAFGGGEENVGQEEVIETPFCNAISGRYALTMYL